MMFLHIWLSLTFLQTLIFVILLFLPTLFFTLNTTAIIPVESIGIALQKQVRCSHNTDGNTLKNQFCFPCFIAFGNSLSTMHI